MPDDQQDVVRFLSDPGSYEPPADSVERIETHISYVFLAGDRAYKLKRAVRLPYVDFSTIEQRKAACEAELVLNRRTAPALYLEMLGLARGADGRIRFTRAEPAIEWTVVMARFEQSQLFDRLARERRLNPALLDALADHIAHFHASAERRDSYGGAAALLAVAEENQRCLAAAKGAGFAAARIAEIGVQSGAALVAQAALLDRRRDAGKVRRCHGDLHLRNICLLDGRPVLFDCIEFSERLASIDILYDLAFLLMDLETRGLGECANRVMNRYLDMTEEEDGLAALPLFLSLRAVIRAHVSASMLEHAAADRREALAAEARSYLDYALSVLAPALPRLVAIGGLSGSGKSSLAARLAPALGVRPGARLVRSDVLRKRLFGLAPENRLPAAAYTVETSRRVYEGLCQKAAALLAAGHSAIVDAVSLLPEERARFAEIARGAGVPFTGIWLDVPAAVMKERIRARHGDASDATPDVLARQLDRDPGPLDWARIDAGAGLDATLEVARRLIPRG